MKTVIFGQGRGNYALFRARVGLHPGLAVLGQHPLALLHNIAAQILHEILINPQIGRKPRGGEDIVVAAV